MRALRIPGAFVLVMVVAVACTPAGEETATAEADVEAIIRAHREYRAAFNAGDLDSLQTFVTDDVVWMSPGDPLLIGKEAIRRWDEPLFDRFTFEYTFSSDEVVVAGNWAFERGAFALTLIPKAGGESFHASGKYVWIWQRQADGSWKNARAIWNRDSPPPEM